MTKKKALMIATYMKLYYCILYSQNDTHLDACKRLIHLQVKRFPSALCFPDLYDMVRIKSCELRIEANRELIDTCWTLCEDELIKTYGL